MKTKKGNVFIKVFAIILVCFLTTVIVSNKYLTTSKYEIKSEKLPISFNGFKIILIADLHNAEFGKNNKTLIRKIEKSNPDIVLLAGDMISTSDTDYNNFFTFADNIGKRFETYYIPGNHEQALGEEKIHDFCEKISQEGIRVLDNEKVKLVRNGEYINLYGMWFNLRFYADRSRDADKSEQYYFDAVTMKEILNDSEKGKFNLLLTHNPVYFETYEKWGADLTLSGHIHGGMIRLPFIGGVYSPEKTYFPKYDGGIYSINKSKMAVSRGLGNGNLGFRFLNCPELVEITLIKD